MRFGWMLMSLTNMLIAARSDPGSGRVGIQMDSSEAIVGMPMLFGWRLTSLTDTLIALRVH